MWNEFKNKFKGLFEEDGGRGYNQTKQTSNGQDRNELNANTKMTYKYPKQGNFRFPVIPDTKSQEAPADSERQSRRKERHSYSNQEKETPAPRNSRRHRTASSSEQRTKDKEVPETPAQPFTPTDVPSPVYGFHPRSTPATNFEELVNKVENNNGKTARMEQARYDEEHWQSVRQRVLGKIESSKRAEEEKEIAEAETAAGYNYEANEELPVSNEEPLEESDVVEEGVQNPEDNFPNSEDPEEEIEQKIKEESPLDSISQEPDPMEQAESPEQPKKETNSYQTQREQKPASREKTMERKSVPFNVVMTPRDKRSRDQQKKTLNKGIENVPERPLQQATPLHLLNDKKKKSTDDEDWIRSQMDLLENTLRQFHVKAKVVHAMKGPAVTRFEVQPEPGVKVSKITNLADDIKLSMAARDIRIEAPIPGKQAVGIEVPNRQPEMVGLQEIFESEPFKNDPSPLSVGLGLDIGGEATVTNLKKMPHGLIAGATGSGKSVCINTILISMLYKAHHEDVKFMLIDPKMVELAPYNGLPHLVSPVITDVKAATSALKWAVKEMEERYEKFVAEGARDVERFNEKMIQQGRREEKLPYLVIVIDELADLMMVSPQDVEDSICRIAQKARACGIHLLLATQRPSVDVITGLIKANIPTRIAFSVSSQVDSRTIIDAAGAEKLLGKGDMLFIENGSGQSVRIQGAFVSDDEIERVTNHVKKIAPPNYLFEQEELMQQVSSEEAADELFEQAVQFVVEQNGASASLLQRRFKVGYNRAARLIDQMADYGIISEAKGSKPRDILLTPQQVEDMMVQ
ncbi:DNA translocase FtsK [Halobacillus sp. A5]|uniref:DNA translocase FtsK n=1 Tax=Halobacillus sp. A5 TaxID=2880263 RepID=UPI00211129C2|nr:DNA translocase FtsK [Halobacillus sp. A5]